MRQVLALVTALLAALPAWAAEPPRYVAGPASGLQYDCRQAGQPVPRLTVLVTEIPDLDGDGAPEHVMDAGKGCAAVRALYCNEREGCTVSVFLSRWSGVSERFKARQWSVDRAARPTTMSIATGGDACGGAAACTLALRWTGARLEPMR